MVQRYVSQIQVSLVPTIAKMYSNTSDRDLVLTWSGQTTPRFKTGPESVFIFEGPEM